MFSCMYLFDSLISKQLQKHLRCTVDLLEGDTEEMTAYAMQVIYSERRSEFDIYQRKLLRMLHD